MTRRWRSATPNACWKRIYAIGFFFPGGESPVRIRTQMSAAPQHLDRAIDAFTRIGRELGVIGA